MLFTCHANTCILLLGKLTAGGIAGGSIMIVVLIAGLILSILWNKGLLPHTRYMLKFVIIDFCSVFLSDDKQRMFLTTVIFKIK